MTTTLTGTRGASGTPATAFLGNGAGTGLLDTELLAQGWKYLKTLTAAMTGSTGPVQVWVPPLFQVGDVSVDPGTRVQLGTLNAAIRGQAIGINTTALAVGATSFQVNETSGAPPVGTPFYIQVVQNGIANEIMQVTARVLVSGTNYTYTVVRNQIGTGGAASTFGAGSASVRYVEFTATVDETATPPATPFWIEVADSTGVYKEAILVTSRVLVAGSQYTYTLDRAVRSPGNTPEQTQVNHRWGAGFLEGSQGTEWYFGAASASTPVYLIDSSLQMTPLANVSPLIYPTDLYIGSEWVRVSHPFTPGTAATDIKFTEQRGYWGSTPAAHAVGADVYAAPFYVGIEADDTNAQLTITIALNISQTGRTSGDLNALNSNSTAGATASAIDSMESTFRSSGMVNSRTQAPAALMTKPWTTNVIRKAIVKTSASGFSYVVNINNKRAIIATRSGALNYYAIAGEATSISDEVGDRMAFLGWHPNNSGVGSNAQEGSTTGWGQCQFLADFTNNQAGTFWYVLGLQWMPYIGSTAQMDGHDFLGPALNGGGTHKFITQNKCTTAWFHGVNGTSNNFSLRPGATMRGYLADCIAFTYSTEPIVGDTVTVGATTYYVIGASTGTGGGNRLPKMALAIKA